LTRDPRRCRITAMGFLKRRVGRLDRVALSSFA
jgi:hypothetical protein